MKNKVKKMVKGKKYFYTYMLRYIDPKDGRTKNYIGRSSCFCDPEKDINYKGSGKNLKDCTYVEDSKAILDRFDTEEQARDSEGILLKALDAKNNPGFLNKSNSSGGISSNSNCYKQYPEEGSVDERVFRLEESFKEDFISFREYKIITDRRRKNDFIDSPQYTRIYQVFLAYELSDGSKEDTMRKLSSENTTYITTLKNFFEFLELEFDQKEKRAKSKN
jgi:hypothetical protein